MAPSLHPGTANRSTAIAPEAPKSQAYQSMYWFLLIGLALAGLGGLMLAYNLRTLERRAIIIESNITEARKDAQTARAAAATALDESRRAHVRLDNHQRSIEAMGRDIGWSDDRAHTKVLTAPIPAMAKKPPR